MNLRDWEIINALYKHKNITKAAQQMFITQPAITARIKQIEDYFDVKIIIRERRGIQFTPEGEYLAEKAREIISQNDVIKGHVINMKDNVSGTLKIGSSNFFAKYKLPKILRKFKQLYPNVECRVITGFSGDVYKNLQSREVHVGFIRGDYPWRGIRDVLFEETLCAVSTFPFEWGDLPHMPRIEYDTDRKLSDLVDDWWNEHYTEAPYIGLHVDQVDTCKEMVINGLGYGIVPSLVFKDFPDMYVKKLSSNDGPIIRKTWLYYDDETLSMNLVKIFVDFVNELDVKYL